MPISMDCMWSVPWDNVAQRGRRRWGEKQMHHEQIMIVAFAAVFLALVTGFALMLG